MTTDTSRQKRGKLGCLLRVFLGGIGLILVAAILLFMAYNHDLYKGQSINEGTLVIRGGTLFDGTGSAPYKSSTIVINKERIVCVGNGCEIPSNATVIDATGLSIMPGLIDLHVHFGAPSKENAGLSFPLMIWDYVRQRPAVRRALLESGVTTIRSVGDEKDFILRLKKQIASGELAGPRVYCVGPIFTAPGGHPVATHLKGNPWLIKGAARQVTDPEEAAAEVERLAREGVDGIKAVYGGREGRLPRLSLDVLQAVIDVAHERGLWVAVHTGSLEEVRDAVQAGANTIEHGVTYGSHLDSGTIELLREKNVTYIPTLAVDEAKLGPEDPAIRLLMDNTNAAKNGGVRIGSGTDTSGPNMSFGSGVHRELELLVQSGLSPEEALLAATRDAAIALQADKDLGTIESDKIADLLLIDGQPWEQISDVRTIRLVIQEGRVVVDKR